MRLVIDRVDSHYDEKPSNNALFSEDSLIIEEEFLQKYFFNKKLAEK